MSVRQLLFAAASGAAAPVMTDGSLFDMNVSTGSAGTFSSAAFGNSVFVAAQGYDCWTSPDGVTWTKHVNVFPTGYATYILFGNGIFMAYAPAGNPVPIQTSPDGVTWTTRANFTGCTYPRMAFGNGVFCILESYYSGTSTGNSWTSTNGVSWTQSGSATGALAQGGYAPFIASASTFVSIISYSTVISTGTNGLSWTTRTGAINAAFTMAAYGASLFVTVSGDTAYETSPTGVTWTSRSAPTYLYSIGYGAQFVATSNNGINLTSANGTTWTQYTGTPTYTNNRGSFIPDFITYGNGRYVAGGGSFNGLYVSQPTGTGGITWTHRTAPIVVSGATPAYGNGVYVLAYGTPGAVYTSTDGNTWTSRGNLAGSQGVVDVAFGAGLFVAAGQAGHTYTSPDGITWTNRSTGGGTNEIIQQIIFDGTKFVAAHYDNVAYTTWTRTSTDGINWTKGTVYSSMYFYGIAYGNGKYVTVTNGFQSYTSTNGLTWTYAGNVSGYPYTKLRFANGLFCFGPGSSYSAGGLIYFTSPDGINWTQCVATNTSQWGTSSYVWDIAGANGRFVLACGSSGYPEPVYRTVDNTNFETRASGGDAWWGSVAYVNGKFFMFSWDTTAYLTS